MHSGDGPDHTTPCNRVAHYTLIVVTVVRCVRLSNSSLVCRRAGDCNVIVLEFLSVASHRDVGAEATAFLSIYIACVELHVRMYPQPFLHLCV